MMKIRNRIKYLFFKKKMTGEEEYNILNEKFTEISKKEIKLTKKKMDEEFNRLLKDCKAESEQTLSVERAEEILINLLSLAVSRRQQLVDNLKSNVESGSVFDFYNDKIKEIDYLQTNLTTNLRFKNYLEKDYEYESAIYKKIVKKTYVDEYVPNQNDLKFILDDNQTVETKLIKDLSSGRGDKLS